MSDPARLRKRIAEAKTRIAGLEGEKKSLTKEVNKALDDLRDELDCDKGEEAEAIKALREGISELSKEIEDSLDRVEEILGD